MISLIYGSSATSQLTQDDLVDILAVARRNNEKLNITGMLLYSDGNFLQVLEGEEEAVESLLATIRKDSRHAGLMVYVKYPIAERQFSNWKMGFIDIDNSKVHEIPGYSDFLSNPDHEMNLSDVSYAKSFLELFRDNIR